MLKFSLMLLMAPLSFGAVIYSNGVASNQNGYNIHALRQADNFSLGSASNLAAIEFYWAHPAAGNAAYFSGTVTYAIYQDSGGVPGAVVSSNTVTGLTSTLTGGTLLACGVQTCPVYVVDFNLPAALALAAGNYWLELHEGNSLTEADGTVVFWATSAIPGNMLTGFGGVPDTLANLAEAAFVLYDTPFSASVPEPAGLSLMAAGLATLAVLRWRTSR